MRPLAITVIITLAATTALPFGTAKAACLPDDLACSVHGGSGMVLERGGFVPRARSGNFYVDRATRAATTLRQSERYRRSAPEREARPEAGWDGLSDWQELGQPGRDFQEMGPGASGITGATPDPYGETTSELDNDPQINPRLRTNQSIRRAPQAPARSAQGPARGPTGIADSPQSAATSFFNSSSNQAPRR